jgi:hypothetical protein
MSNSYDTLLGRRCHNSISPVHACVYFAPEQQDALAALGLERGSMTYQGAALRAEAEAFTDRLDAAPYDHLGPAATSRLTELAGGFAAILRAAGAFPAEHFGKG